MPLPELTAPEARLTSGQAVRDEQKGVGQTYGFAVLGVTELDQRGIPKAYLFSVAASVPN